MISVVASIRMACLGTGLAPGLGINMCCNILLQQNLLPRFSNVVKSKESTQSKPTKANNETRQYIHQATHNNNLSLNFPKATIFKHT